MKLNLSPTTIRWLEGIWVAVIHGICGSIIASVGLTITKVPVNLDSILLIALAQGGLGLIIYLNQNPLPSNTTTAAYTFSNVRLNPFKPK